MKRTRIFSIYLVVGFILMILPFNGTWDLLDEVSAAPDDGIDGFQEHDGDWIVTDYEEYSNEIIALHGELTIQNGGRLVLYNCTLMMMSIILAPYSIIVENGGILEMYDCYITDTPDDDDTEFLSAYYYFIARSGSTLIIENSTLRQSGFIDMTNAEHMGVFVGTNTGHISNTNINTSLVGLSFMGNNTGFVIENVNISQIQMMPVLLAYSKGVIINNASFDGIGERTVVSTQDSSGFSIENISLPEDHDIEARTSSGFTIRNIIGDRAHRMIQIEDCTDFQIEDILVIPGEMWNRRIEIARCSNFSIENISTADDTDVISFEDSSNGTISNILVNNVTRFIDIKNSDNIELSKITIINGSETIRTWESEQILLDNINLYNITGPSYYTQIIMNSTDNSTISNLTILGLEGEGITILYGSENVTISNTYIETDSLEVTRGLWVDSSSVNVKGYTTYNINYSIFLWSGDIIGEDILVNGTYEPSIGIEINEAEEVYLSNITVLNPRSYGIRFMDCQGGNVRVDNVYVNDTTYGIDFVASDATLSDLFFDNVKYDIQTSDNSHITVMNSTINEFRLIDSEIICIDAVNASFSQIIGSSSLIWKWWVDVYVTDSRGEVAGAKIDIFDDPGPVEIQSITGADGFARNIPVTEVIWTPGLGADYITPHYARAWETGWEAFSTSYFVNNNMQMNVFYLGNTPPNAPTNMGAYSDEDSNTILTWELSTSWDVTSYDIYIARDIMSLENYMTAGIPNASVAAPQNNYVHESGSEDWKLFHYAVKSNDGSLVSTRYAKSNCGDWVVNKTTPQYVSGKNITLSGSLWIYGDLELINSSLHIDIYSELLFGIFINNSANFIVENVTIAGVDRDPYFFYIDQDARVSINGSKIIRPGDETLITEEYMKGILSYTRYLTITNSTIETRYWGLGIHGVSDFLGTIYNVSFISYEWEQAEYLLYITSSSYINIEECKMDARAIYGINAYGSSHLNISYSNISLGRFDDRPYWAVLMQDCTHSQIYENTFIISNPGIYLLNSENITIEKSNVSAHHGIAIHGESSRYITVRNCSFGDEENNPDIAIYMSWCRYSTIEDMEGIQNDNFIRMENESSSTIKNVSTISGDVGIYLVNSDNIYLDGCKAHIIQTGIMISGCSDIYLTNILINLTINCLVIKSPGPINIIDSTIKNGINGEIIAEGYGGELGNIIIENSTISAMSKTSLILNNSAAVHLINSSVNLSRVRIDDSGSRIELYHYLSVQVYDIDSGIPSWANITILNAKDNLVLTNKVDMGYVQWILIHEKTIFKEANYSDNPHRIYFDDGSHAGEVEVYINETQHLDVQVSNLPPWILWITILGYYDMPDPIPDIFTNNPKTNFDIVLDYLYQDLENDPESGTIIHWYINGIYYSSFDGLKTIDSQYTSKYQTWHAVAYPSDGYDSTYPLYPFESGFLYIDNTPPEVNNVIITPSTPTGGDDLFVDYNIYDIDGDGLDSTKTSHRWYFYNETSGDWEFSGIDSYYLSSQYTSKGQRWRCNVTPNDGADYGATVISQEVIIGNTPPSVTNPRIISETGSVIVTGKDNLKVVYNFTDSDGDLESGTSYEWYLSRDGGDWTKYDVNSNILPSNYTRRADLWRCRIIPMDGTDMGEEAWTDVHEVFNTPPTVSNVTITPQNPTSSDALEVTYDFYDYDGDTDNGTSFRWVYEDAFGVGWDSGISGNVTQAERTFKGQRWFCYVTPSDGINVGPEAGSLGVLINNSPPDITTAEVQFNEEDGDRWLLLLGTPEDTDGDTVVAVAIKWFIDGSEQPQFENQTVIAGEDLKKNQKWHAEVRVFDGEDWSSSYTTDNITIPNTPPYLNGTVILTPQKPLSNRNLKPTYENLFRDDDGDSFSSVEIKWYKDNGHMEDYDDQTQISWDLTKKGEIWYCKVRVSDGEDTSDWYSSTTTVVKNSPPSDIILNQEEGEVIMTETETLEFNVSSVDIDGDPLSYRWTLDGRIVLLDEGVGSSIYLMKTTYDSEGEYILRLVITDGDDTNETTWTVNVHKKNRLPEIEVNEPITKNPKMKENTYLKFMIDESDQDPEDTLQITWYFDDVEAQEGGSSYTYFAGSEDAGEHEVSVNVSDGEDSVEYSWNLSVQDIEEGQERIFGLLWDQWSIILEVLVIAGSGLLAFIGYSRIKRKKGALKTYMAEIEDLSAKEDLDPEGYDEKITEIEAKINDEFMAGKIEDLHYLMLQDIIASKRGEVRKAHVTRKFDRLPDGIVKELDEMLKDGKISREEYEGFVATISKTKTLSDDEKKELSKMIGEWEVEDKEIIEDEIPKPDTKPKKENVDEDILKEIEEMGED
ncbi:MAG: right-handed parallel beta-helix repeat-containing protein [Thermoplasmata archaeon]|nr:MAG: right-handed parallel beta-helix repeat-containing protein [Thermoplasmata archaeon]